MADRVLLHVGAMKSGTSFIQSTLAANRAVLRRQDVLFPGETWRDQVNGVVDVLGHGRDGAKPATAVGAWARLVEEIAAWPGTAVISMEFLGATPVADIKRVVESLRPANVEVVLTVRDLARTIPAMWQEEIQNGATWRWEEFLHAVEHGNPEIKGPSRQFWRQQRTALIARRWAETVGRENFTLVTVPPPGAPPEVLLDRFCEVLGVETTDFAPPRRRNPSIGVASALVVRALNERLGDGTLPRARYNQLVKTTLAKNGLAHRAASEPTAGFSARWVRRRSEQMIERFEKLGVRVVGDLGDLRPARVPGVNPSKVSERDQLDAAIDGLVQLVQVWPPS